MSDTLITLLERCTVKITGENAFGSGFFIAPKVVLTAAHVLDDVVGLANKIQLQTGDKILTGTAIYRGDQHRIDVALVELEEPQDDWVLFGSDVTLHDRFYTFGYSKSHPGGESVKLKWEGFVRDEHIGLLKFREGQLVPGMSGAPLLNLRTGAVCGMVLVTRDARLDLGGHVISTRALIAAMPERADLFRSDNSNAARWTRLASPFGAKDLTIRESHYKIFPQEDIDVLSVFVEPDYCVWRYEQTDRHLSNNHGFESDCIHILETQKILFLFGPYGSGKTVLTKVLQQRLRDKGYEVVFFRCDDIIDRIDRLERSVENRSADANPLVIALDGYDETNLLRHDKKDIKRRLLGRLFDLLFSGKVFLILNSRLIPMDEEIAYLGISQLMFDQREEATTLFVELKPFGNAQIDAWLEAYSNEQARYGHENRLYRNNLRGLHKNLISACKNPLFLYMLTARYYEQGIDSVSDIYALYDSFVSKTVTGKFRFERAAGASSIAEIANRYRRFLQDMAMEICINSDLTFDAAQLDAWSLDSNTATYAIPYEQVKDTVQRTAAEILDSSLLEEIDKRRLISNILSCYFLEESGKLWRFKDNNILFFLVAEVFVEALLAAARGPAANDLAVCFPDFLRLRRIPLHPLSVELLLTRLMTLEPGEKNQLAKFLCDIFKNAHILHLRQTTGIVNDDIPLRLGTLLALTFLRLYKFSYKESAVFFKSLRVHTDILRQVDHSTYDVLRAFFRKLDILDGEIEGYQFDGFNFQDSQFSRTRFERSDFIDPAFDFVHFDAVQFNRCKIVGLKAFGISGSARFEECDIDIEIKQPGSIELNFERCHIKDLHLYADRYLRTVKVHLTFTACRIDNIIIRKLEVPRLILHGSEYPTLKLEGSRVTLCPKDSTCTSRKQVQTDGQSDVRIVK